MKKAKMMFTALTVLAVVGGALAFKAKNFDTKVIYTGDLLGTSCTVSTTSAELGGAANEIRASIEPLTENCPVNFTRPVAND